MCFHHPLVALLAGGIAPSDRGDPFTQAGEAGSWGLMLLLVIMMSTSVGSSLTTMEQRAPWRACLRMLVADSCTIRAHVVLREKGRDSMRGSTDCL